MRKSKYTKELLEPIIKNSNSVSQVLDSLNLKKTGGNYRYIQSKIKFHGLDTSHFTAQAWAKGLTKETSEAVASARRKLRTPDKEVFCQNSSYTKGPQIAQRLCEDGLEYKCNICHISSWLGEALTLHLDHINGISNDNRKENLRLLCPNCHQQTETWGNKNRKLAKKQEASI